MAGEAFVVFKILHVFFAAAWIGGVLFFLGVIQPALQRSGPQVMGPAMLQITPAQLRFGNGVGGLTLVFGLLTTQFNPYGFGWGDMHTHNWGRLVLFGLIATLAMLYLINFAIKPTALKILEMAKDAPKPEPGVAPGPPPAGLVLLQKRMMVTSRLVLGIGVLVLVAMVAANSGLLTGVI